MKTRNFGNKMIIVADEAPRDRRSTVTIDELELKLEHFEQLAAKPEPAVYQYRYADLPEQLTASEVLANNRRRWEEFYDA